jgi:GSH-dependent disulfide-bond oxidoreductase
MLQYDRLAKGWLYRAAEFLSVDYKHLQRWADMLLERPTVRWGRMVNRLSGEPSSQLRERHDASDFETRTQDKLEADSLIAHAGHGPAPPRAASGPALSAR